MIITNWTHSLRLYWLFCFRNHKRVQN